MKKSMKVAACVCTAACALSLCACGAAKSTVITGSNNDGSKGATATYLTDGENYTAANNLARAYGEIIEDFCTASGNYNTQNIEDFYLSSAKMWNLSDMGLDTKQIEAAGSKAEQATQMWKQYVEPAASASSCFVEGETGRQSGDEMGPGEDLAAIQAAYEKAGGKATITSANTMRPSFNYTFEKAYGAYAAGSTWKNSVYLENVYLLEIDGQWYLFDNNLTQYL